jgi:hypothetical protein
MVGGHQGGFSMKSGSKEAELRKILNGMDEAGQTRLLDTARALGFAAKTYLPISRFTESNKTAVETSGGQKSGFRS